MTWLPALLRLSPATGLSRLSRLSRLTATLGNERAIANARVLLDERETDRRRVDALVNRLEGREPAPPSAAA